MWKHLLAAAFVFGFVAPAGAVASKSLVSVATIDSSVIYQQDKCKEGEKWNEETKKCEKKEG
jgi:hypothetical protein